MGSLSKFVNISAGLLPGKPGIVALHTLGAQHFPPKAYGSLRSGWQVKNRELGWMTFQLLRTGFLAIPYSNAFGHVCHHCGYGS
eukprot:171147-Hanusia_phi.AAC.1